MFELIFRRSVGTAEFQGQSAPCERKLGHHRRGLDRNLHDEGTLYVPRFDAELRRPSGADGGNWKRADAAAVRVRSSMLRGVQARGPIGARCHQAWRRSEVPALHRFQFANEAVNLLEKCVPAGVRHASEHRGRMLCNTRLARQTRPSPDIAIGDECKTPQIATPSGKPKIREQVVETQLQGCRGIHVAVQHVPGT